jgi:hypothetical protein
VKDTRESYLARIPPMSRGIVERALAGTASPRGAIKAMCLICSGFDRSEVADCRVIACALHAYRRGRRASADEAAVGTAPEGEPCHADVLIELADAEARP